MHTTLKRMPNVPHRSLPMPNELVGQQIQRGLCTVDRGVTYPLPIDHVRRKNNWQHRDIWTSDKEHGTHRKGTVFKVHNSLWQGKTLAWLRDHVNSDIPNRYYNKVLGHSIDVSMSGSGVRDVGTEGTVRTWSRF